MRLPGEWPRCWAYPVLSFLIGPSQERTAGGWVPVGDASEFPLNQPTLINATVAKQRGWVVEQQELSVFVSTEDGSDLLPSRTVAPIWPAAFALSRRLSRPPSRDSSAPATTGYLVRVAKSLPGRFLGR